MAGDARTQTADGRGSGSRPRLQAQEQEAQHPGTALSPRLCSPLACADEGHGRHQRPQGGIRRAARSTFRAGAGGGPSVNTNLRRRLGDSARPETGPRGLGPRGGCGRRRGARSEDPHEGGGAESRGARRRLPGGDRANGAQRDGRSRLHTSACIQWVLNKESSVLGVRSLPGWVMEGRDFPSPRAG